MDCLIVPAILVKDRDEFRKRLDLVRPFAKRIQIDIMDGEFVPNTTLQPEGMDFSLLEGFEVEFHLMVSDPKAYVESINLHGESFIYQFHFESFSSEQELVELINHVRSKGSRVNLAISPDTQVSSIEKIIPLVQGVLVMTVYPGFSGQSYLAAMEQKLMQLRDAHPNLDLEVDGGIDLNTIKQAARAGANLFGASSSLFKAADVQTAFSLLLAEAVAGSGKR